MNKLSPRNPSRFRGGTSRQCSYSQDTETNFYYLQSRYYDPEIGRFINADALVSTGQGMLGNNMFAYCGNNPVNYLDVTGNRFIGVGFQLDFDTGDTCIGYEIVIYFDEDVCNGNDFAVVTYTYSGASAEGIDMLVSDTEMVKEIMFIITEMGTADHDALLFALQVFFEKELGVSAGAFLLFGNDDFDDYRDYEGSFTTVYVSGEYKCVSGAFFRSSCDTCVTYGAKFGPSIGGRKSWLPFALDLGVSRTYYTDTIVWLEGNL